MDEAGGALTFMTQKKKVTHNGLIMLLAPSPEIGCYFYYVAS